VAEDCHPMAAAVERLADAQRWLDVPSSIGNNHDDVGGHDTTLVARSSAPHRYGHGVGVVTSSHAARMAVAPIMLAEYGFDRLAAQLRCAAGR
jgi:hypothetical protein